MEADTQQSVHKGALRRRPDHQSLFVEQARLTELARGLRGGVTTIGLSAKVRTGFPGMIPHGDRRTFIA